MLEKIVCRVSFVALLLVPGVVWGDAEVIDGIAAVVNGDVITFSQVQEVAAPEEQSLKQQFTGQELIDKIKETRLAVLNDLINRQLTKKSVSDVIDMVYRHCGQKECVIFADRLMGLGFGQAAKAGISFGKDDLIIPQAKEKLIKEAQTKVKVTATLGGAWKPATLPQWSELGLKNGRKIITVIGTIDTMPSTVANAAPSLIPR